MDIRVREDYLARAMEIHQMSPVVDAHLDLAGEILMRYQAGERDVVRRHYLANFRKAGMKLIVSSVFVDNENLGTGWQNALDQIAALKEDVRDVEEITLIYGRQDLERLLKGDRIGILLYMEGLDCIGEDIDRLSELYRLGVRGASLTWSRSCALGTGCCKAAEHRQIPGGLTGVGRRAVRRLEELSMFLDVSHLNDEGFDDVCRIAEKKFIATHSGSRQIFHSYRNLTDEQIQALASQGGVMGMNGCQCIAGSLRGNHLEMLCRHIEYEVQKAGAAHVGYGFDLCDSYEEAEAVLKGEHHTERDDCLLDHSQVPLVTAALLQRGMDQESVKAIVGGNFIDYFREVLPA